VPPLSLPLSLSLSPCARPLTHASTQHAYTHTQQQWLYSGQRSFRLTREQYADKLDSTAALVNALGQTALVRGFLRAPARSQKGMPARPVVGTAITIRLNLAPEVIEEWFGSGFA
jgi:hypothetical protein